MHKGIAAQRISISLHFTAQKCFGPPILSQKLLQIVELDLNKDVVVQCLLHVHLLY